MKLSVKLPTLIRLFTLLLIGGLLLGARHVAAQRDETADPSPTIENTPVPDDTRPTRPTPLPTTTPAAPGGDDTGRTPTITPQNDGSSRTPTDYPTVVGFRSPARTPLGCSDATLNENLSVVNTGKAGPGCSLDVEVRATGEWVLTGGFFDSPPYVWGQWPDRYNSYGDNIFIPGNGLAFECSLPAYTLDRSALPTYVTISNEQDNPSGDPFTAPTKRYQLNFAADAPLGQSFTLPLAFSSTCRLIGNNAGTIIVNETIQPGFYPNCDQAPLQNINPRQKSLQHRITISETCTPPVTSTPPLPPPSNTPIPTPSKVPCNMPCTGPNQCPLDCPQCTVGAGGQSVCKSTCDTPCTGVDQCPLNCPVCIVGPNGRSTCQPAQCKCDGLDVSSGTLDKGQTVTFVTYVKVDPNNPAGNDAEARSVIFRLEKKAGEGWQEITNSGVVAFVGPTLTPGGTTGVRRYAATWTTTVPAVGNGLTGFRVRVADKDITCGYRGTLTTPTPTASPGVSDSSSAGFLGSILQFFGLQETNLPPVIAPALVTIVVPSDARSLQLGTFLPDTSTTPAPRIIKSCKQLEFEVNY